MNNSDYETSWNETSVYDAFEIIEPFKRHILVIDGEELQRFYVVGPLEDDNYYRFYYDSHIFVTMFYIGNFLRMNHVRGGSLDTVKARVEKKYADFRKGIPTT